MPTFDSDKAMTVCGVAGRLTHRTTKPGQAPGLWCNQRWISEARSIAGYGVPGVKIRAEIRFDDECGNGHNSFAVTADIYRISPRGKREDIAGGCCHDEIAKAFPELAHLIKWHLFDSSGPMHYVANTVYHAGNRDHWGKLKGEPRSFDTFIRFGDNPILHAPGRHSSGKFIKWLQSCAPLHGEAAFDFEVLPFDHDDRKTYGTKYTFGGFAEKWHECPFDTEQAALNFLYALQHCKPEFVSVATSWGEGKEREFTFARSTAVWPEATDEQLSAEPAELKVALLARLPALVAAFRADIEAAGFLWAPELVAA
jgi:hypothetical protein